MLFSSIVKFKTSSNIFNSYEIFKTLDGCQSLFYPKEQTLTLYCNCSQYYVKLVHIFIVAIQIQT